MSSPITRDHGIDLDQVQFDEHGAIVPLDDDALDDVAGGLMHEHPNGNCDFNVNC